MKRIVIFGLLLCLSLLSASQIFGEEVKTITQPPENAGLQKIINLDFKDTPFLYAMDVLFKDTGIFHRVDFSPGDMKVTALIKGVTLEQACKEIARASGTTVQIGYSGLGGRATVVFNRPSSGGYGSGGYGYGGYGGSGYGSGSTPTPQPGQVQKIVTLKYMNPIVLANTLGAMNIEVSRVPVGNKLVLTGSEEDVKKAMEIIATLDDESMAPKTIRVKLEAVIFDVEHKDKPYTITTESVMDQRGSQGLDVMTYYDKDGKKRVYDKLGNELIDYKQQVSGTLRQGTKNYPWGITNIINTLLLDQDGRIKLGGELLFESTLYNLESNPKYDVYVAQSKPYTIAAGIVENAGKKSGFEIRVTATVENGQTQMKPVSKPAPRY